MSALVKFCEVHVNFKTTSEFLFNFCIILHCQDTYNSTVNLKLIHFLLWTKASYQSSNFDSFECSGENLQNSSCHFLSNKSVWLQILHYSSVLWKITPLYFFRSNVIYFAQKEPIKVEILRISSAQVKIHQIIAIFETTNQIFFWISNNSSVSWDINPLHFFGWNFIYFQQKELIKVQICWNFTWAVESLKFCTLLGSLCPNLQLNECRRVIFHDT